MLLIVVALVWLAGVLYRIYQQAHYFQIEEYTIGRYLRWVISLPPRWLPNRAWVAVLVGLGLTLMLSEAPGDLLPGMIGIIMAAAAVWPTPQREIKKAFRATSRARRLLGAAFAVAALIFVLLALVIPALPGMPQVRFVVVAVFGLAVYLAAPLILVSGSLLMMPVEAVIRRRFIGSARRVLADIQPVVIGITGSYGKTSTKSYLAHILNGRFRAYPTPKSYNTLMGVCLAINKDLADDHSIDYFIVEMGAYVPGEIEEICDLTHPQIAIVTEVGPQHLERFGTLENTAIAKYEIIKALPPDGVGIFNWDNPHVRAMYTRGYPAARIAVSRELDLSGVPDDGPRFIASNVVESLNETRFTIADTQTGQSEAFVTALLGLHNITNILLATAVAVHEGLSLRDVAWQVRSL